MAISREVLVLNRGWQPLRIASFKDAMGALTTCHPDGTPKARIIDPVSFQQFTWDDWSQLTIEEGEDRIHGAMKDFKVPEVIVLTRYDKIHTQRNFNRRTLFRRDDFQCFVPSTQILMADCSLKPICEIKIGDKILDAFGKEQIVEFVHCRQAVPDEMISIKHRGNGDPLFCTMDHKILDFSWKDGSQVNLEGCQAGSLGLNSYLAEIIPEIPIGNKKIDLYELAKENIKHIKLIDGMVKHYSGNPVIRYINLNNDLGKLCGYFLSEGCIHKTHVSFSLNGKTEISYANEIMSLLKIIFGVSSTWDVDGNRGVVICCSTIVRLFFLTFFGKKDDKHIGIKYNREFLEGVLYGVCRGDATYNSDQSRCSVQMSRVELIKEIYIISLMLGFRPSLSKTGFRSDGRISKII
jgi:5-methylcytosine-specific restriction endonuclease McrA